MKQTEDRVMVGGIVIGIARSKESTLLHVQDNLSPGGADRCSIRVIERRIDRDRPVSIGLGDSIWWQAGQAMWTPKFVVEEGIDTGRDCGNTWDICLPKVGYSH
jgi:hypothetical protein